MHNAFLGIGSNLGDRARHLAEAVRRLHAPPDVSVRAVSSLYETSPVGLTAQPDFLNAAVHVETSCTPRELLARCLAVEAALGRVRRERWGPRTIDIDILLFDDAVVQEPTLTLPHPRLRERAFVVIPLAELAPALRLNGETAADLAARIDRTGIRPVGPLAWAAAS